MGLYRNLRNVEVEYKLQNKIVNYVSGSNDDSIKNDSVKKRKDLLEKEVLADTKLEKAVNGEVKLSEMVGKVEDMYKNFPQNLMTIDENFDKEVNWLEGILDLNEQYKADTAVEWSDKTLDNKGKNVYVSLNLDKRRTRLAKLSGASIVAGAATSGLSMLVKKLPIPLKVVLGMGAYAATGLIGAKRETQNVKQMLKILKTRADYLQEQIDELK